MARKPLQLSLESLDERVVPTVAAHPQPPAPTVALYAQPLAPTVAPHTQTPAPTVAPHTQTPAPTDSPHTQTPAPTIAPHLQPPAPTDAPHTQPPAPTDAPHTQPPAPTVAPHTQPPAQMPPVPMPVENIHSSHPLTGRGIGQFTSQRKNPDTGTTFHMNGKATLQGLGKVTVDGDIHRPGFIKSDTYSGRLSFHTGHGEVVVELTSFRPAGPAGLPVWYRYHIVSGTGPFKTMHDSGSLRLDVQVDPSMGPSADQHGSFRLTI